MAYSALAAATRRAAMSSSSNYNAKTGANNSAVNKTAAGTVKTPVATPAVSKPSSNIIPTTAARPKTQAELNALAAVYGQKNIADSAALKSGQASNNNGNLVYNTPRKTGQAELNALASYYGQRNLADQAALANGQASNVNGSLVYNKPNNQTAQQAATGIAPTNESYDYTGQQQGLGNGLGSMNWSDYFPGMEYPGNYSPLSASDMMAQAQLVADNQTLPLLAAIKRAKEEYETQMKAQGGLIDAQYAGIEDTANRLLKDASDDATERAIARGGGRSGAVEYMIGQASEPIMERVTEAKAEQAAKKSALQLAYENYLQQMNDRGIDAETARGGLVQQYYNQLYNNERSMAAARDQNVANFMLGQQGNAINYYNSLLPYQYQTVDNANNLQYNYTNAFGQQAASPFGQTSNTQPAGNASTSLRQYAQSAGKSVGYDNATGKVTIGNKSFTPAQLQAAGAVAKDGTYYISASNAKKLLGY